MARSGRSQSVIRMAPKMSVFVDCNCGAVEVATCVVAHTLASNVIAMITELAAERIRDVVQTLEPYDRSFTHHRRVSRRISC